MVQRLVKLALSLPLFVFTFATAVLILGLYAYSQLDIEAYPNPVAPMIEIITQPEGLSAEEVERYITIPVETAVSGMTDLDHIRSQSLFGLSDVKCYFNWNPEYYQAQQRVLNRLQTLNLPDGTQPTLSPWSAIGEVFRYRLVGEGYSTQELKTAEDWILEKQWRQVPGVVDVVSFGGEQREYQVGVDPFRLKGHGVGLPTLMDAITHSNQNVGGGRIALGEQSFNVRGTGLLGSLKDIGDIVVTATNGVPIRVRDLAGGVLLRHVHPRGHAVDPHPARSRLRLFPRYAGAGRKRRQRHAVQGRRCGAPAGRSRRGFRAELH